MLVFVELFTEFVVFVAIRNEKVTTIIRAMETRVFSYFGSPTLLHTDNESALVGVDMVGHLKEKVVKL